ncbi:MAG: hypothetical protein ABI311_05960 [Gemmatimonadaceae bacterium]
MPEQSDFDDSIRREERKSLNAELLTRLEQKGVPIRTRATESDLADLLSAIGAFESAVEAAGGDLMIDTPSSSEPERPEWVLPHPSDDESVSVYTRRVNAAIDRVRPVPKR